MIQEEKIELIKGDIYTDQRGSLRFFNNFDLGPIKRFYVSEHPDVNIVKAWQGHKKEQKWFYVIAGSFKVILVQPDDWDNPSEDLEYEEFVLDVNKNEVLSVPGGHASGFKALLPNSKLMVFSDFSLDDSLNDDFRYGKDLWYKW
ncbi:WxcM-like domain-containing protein [Pedobacter panaciterrae]|uniref:WxcM-like domain-containing protein n=1 Tax=Pedobacter panaciterrae TaxID=363849 RepID=UPI00155D99C3|nr:WxcM-like domain-containing protein [Pedobacter panaciterrae]NQX55202.1 WxcM-like domain-containing protein [Pedobacter panaciterrae]